MSDTNDKEIEDKITNILKSVREFTKDLKSLESLLSEKIKGLKRNEEE